MIIEKDTFLEFKDHIVHLMKLDTVVAWNSRTWNTNVAGTNTYQEDTQTNYIFSIKKLGWANIDRLFTDPRTQEIELIVNVGDFEAYDRIYTSMIFKKQNMYLPGYQKEDDSFSFTHGDYESTSLPVGETATILITAYKDEIPFYALKTFTIEEAQTLNFELEVITKEALKEKITNEI